MLKCRLLYRKEFESRYISHLDLMRVFRRSFARAKLPLVFSQGFNPHPYLSVPLPLPTGFDSECDLLDFDLDLDEMPGDLLERLNAAFPHGVSGQQVYLRTRGGGDIAAASYRVSLTGEGFDVESVHKLFTAGPIVMMKRTKRGETEEDITRFIRKLGVEEMPGGVVIRATLAAGNESLNPEYLTKAVQTIDGAKISCAQYCRTAILDAKLKEFA